ncbi:MAG: hypothetical protein KY410_08330, partial [Proteobacteria bacterium]|nr:hypothetical protein [Pseudomonadota bacterium]
VIDADDSEGLAMDTLQVNVTVRSTFSTFQAASVVIGQQDFTGGFSRQDPDALAAGANTLDHPSGAVDYVEERDLLYIADTQDARVLGFRGIPEENNANADFVIGQPDFTTTTGETSQERVRRAEAVTARESALLIADPDSHRVTVYNELPESGPGQADVVLGQENFEDFNNACEPHRMNHVHNQFITPSGRLMVADANNNRILVWDEVPEVIGELPDLVIGQRGLDQCAPNDDNQDGFEDAAASARTLRHPVGIWSDDERLVIVDNYNNRVLLWHEFPKEDFAPADVVLGQLSMDLNVPNDDNGDRNPDAAPTARVVDYPWSAWFEQNQLFVTDAHNHRVLIWNGWPEQSSRPADTILGQDTFEKNLPNAGNENPSARTLNSPMGVRVVDHKLLVTDTNNSRVLIFRPQFE